MNLFSFLNVFRIHFGGWTNHTFPSELFSSWCFICHASSSHSSPWNFSVSFVSAEASLPALKLLHYLYLRKIKSFLLQINFSYYFFIIIFPLPWFLLSVKEIFNYFGTSEHIAKSIKISVTTKRARLYLYLLDVTVENQPIF